MGVVQNVLLKEDYMFIFFGIDEMKKQEKAKAFVYFLGSAFILYVGVSNILS